MPCRESNHLCLIKQFTDKLIEIELSGKINIVNDFLDWIYTHRFWNTGRFLPSFFIPHSKSITVKQVTNNKTNNEDKAEVRNSKYSFQSW